MKNLANCKPSEFLRQTNLIRKSVEHWMEATDVIGIRQRMPVLEMVPTDATIEAKREVFARNDEKRQRQARENLSAMLDAALEEHPDETLEILGLCCFVPKEEIDDHPMSEYLDAFNELIGNEAVLNFFTLLVRLGRTSTPAKSGD